MLDTAMSNGGNYGYGTRARQQRHGEGRKLTLGAWGGSAETEEVGVDGDFVRIAAAREEEGLDFRSCTASWPDSCGEEGEDGTAELPVVLGLLGDTSINGDELGYGGSVSVPWGEER